MQNRMKAWAKKKKKYNLGRIYLTSIIRCRYVGGWRGEGGENLWKLGAVRPGLVILAGTGIEPGPGLILNSYLCIYDIIDNTVHIFLI